MNNKIGLSLGGGGAKGSYQIGVLKALEEFNLLDKISVVAGTSIGAINTLLLMNYTKVDDITEVWKNINNELVYKSGIKIFSSNKIFDTNPLFVKLSSYVDDDKIKKSKYQGYALASRVVNKNKFLSDFRPSNLELVEFDLNTFIMPRNAVLASASIPGLFGSTEMFNETYVDGGLKDNYPVNILYKEQCNIIFFVPLDNFYKVETLNFSDKMVINFATEESFYSTQIFDKIDTVIFSDANIKFKYIQGYLNAKKMIKNLIKSKVINEDRTINYVNNKLFSLTKEESEYIYKKIVQGVKV